MTETSKNRTYAVVLLAFLMVFLYQLAGVFSKIQTWEILWNPPTVADMLLALVAGLGAMGAALGLDAPALIKGFVKE